MPANKKHLSSPLQRFLKITAGFIGGFVITEALHMVLAIYFDTASMIFTVRYMGFIVWAALMIVAFLAKSGWKIWGIYFAISVVLGLIVFFNNNINTL
ncbi:hypothetical protein [Joostella sp. CR20]|uniref:hypothetical protein n=1 Tax=Joostella sp. CR20 TaxID=2804312 RepID=UPI00313F1DC2